MKFARQQKKYYYRVQLEHEINEFLRLRMRVMGAIDPGVDGQWSGLGYADMRYKPDHTKSSFTFRWNFFLIPDYSLRLYVYENDVLYSHSIPAFGKSGTRVYAIWTYRLSKRFRIQMKSGISLFQEGIRPNESSAYPLKGVPDVRILIRWKK